MTVSRKQNRAQSLQIARQNVLWNACEQLEQRRLLAFSVAWTGAALSGGPDGNASVNLGEQSETAVYINPTNPRNVVAFANDISSINPDKCWYSFDGGATYTETNIPNPVGHTGSGDPAAAFDRAGNLYFVHLTNSGGLNVSIARSTDGGVTWGNAVVIQGTGDCDKEWINIGPDPNNLANDIIYVGYRRDVGADTQIHVERSLDGGLTWLNDTIINDDSAGALNDFSSFPVPVVNKENGRVYVVWDDFTNNPAFSEIMVDSSTDGGVTWGVDQLVGTTPVTRNNPTRYDIPAQPDREILAVPSIAIAPASSPNNGRLYVAYTIENAAGQPNTDIRVARSDSASGAAGTWTNVTVNNVTSNSQFHPWVDTDPMSGAVFVGWMDCRNDTNTGVAADTDTNNVANDEIQMFVAASINDGVSYIGNIAISDGVSIEAVTNATRDANNYGEYDTTVALGGMAYTVWSDNSNSTGDNPDGITSKDVYTNRTVLSGATITYTGTNAANTITVDMDPTSTFVYIWEGASTGTPDFIYLENSIDGLVFDMLGGADTVNILEIDSSMPITVNGGTGNDTLTMGDNDLDNNIDSAVTFNGDADTDRVNLNDAADTTGDTFTLTNSDISKPGFGPFVYSATLEQMVLNASPNNETFSIERFPTTLAVTLNGNDGNDLVDDVFNDLNTNWLGNLSIAGGLGTDSISLSDTGDLTATEYTITSSQFGVTAGITTNLFGYSAIENFAWNTNTDPTTIVISSTSTATTYIVNGNSGNDIFELGVNGGNAEGLNGALTITGDAGTDSWTYFDGTNGFGDAYVLTSTTITRTSNGVVTYSTFESAVVNGGSSTDTYDIQSSAAGTPVTVNGGTGKDIFTVGNGDWDLNLGANVRVNGDADFDLLTINDLTDIGADSYTVATGSFTKSSTAVTVTSDVVEGFTLDANGVNNTINMTSGTSGYRLNGNAGVDNINVIGHQLGTTVAVDGGTGLDNVTSNNDAAGFAFIVFDLPQDLASLRCFNGGTIQVQQGGANLLRTQAVQVDASGSLDLTNNDMILDYAGVSPLATVNTLIAAARNGGLWNGFGITSTTAAANALGTTTLGALEATQYDSVYGPGALFNGVDPDLTSVLVKYTYYGDTDFNGFVDFDDYVRIDGGFNNGLSGWLNGDFDQSGGDPDFDDYVLIDNAFNNQGAPL